FVHNKIPVSECIISETGIYTNCGRGSNRRQQLFFSSTSDHFFFNDFPFHFIEIQKVSPSILV
ncbi:hypothetical protein Q7376_03315, partial [Glaesserella parasuis]|nr:hypothetical protein [Glaesserella parasuis]MDP0017818.1 hypothetical protein [Glaesserella parasuis]MDP0024090.1 hypothetical protein [Glaesserella parasuis]MDP0049382.1 hypothetical protein [Glaesserella parasuis]MDP0111146.1 hypothetical protein [Glaesserella parasuis]